MVFIVEAFFSGCISKVINDVKDYSWVKIKREINDKNDQNLYTKIYRVIERALNIVTDKKFKDTDKLYDSIERIFNEFKDNGDILEAVKCGLGLLCSDVSEQRCENFLDKFYEGVCQDEDLYKRINLILQEKGIKITQEEFQQLNGKIDNLTEIVSSRNDNEIDFPKREPVKNRTKEYADKWNDNMFLNNFDKRDENAGVNVKLSEVYLEEHLPHYIWKDNRNIAVDLKDLLKEYIYPHYDNQMLLILGQPGIGKSTLITWITANFTDRIDDILVYKFASDLEDVDWKSKSLSNRILEKLGLEYIDLDRKTLILDGLDEVNVDNRYEVLESLYGDLIYGKVIQNFSLIITCRENYIEEIDRVKSRYITLQPWDEAQIKSFCNIFQEKAKNNISENTMEKLIESRNILGIPLILYMVLALNISIEKEGSIVDIYDKIFSLDGGIYDRCINNKYFADKHRISAIKRQIHQISREISIWMFENNPEEAYIPQEEYQKICNNVMEEQQKSEKTEQDSLIGNFFKLVKHCESVETKELYFVHRSIYEYFVAETIFSSIENAMIKLTEESQEELAGNIVIYLKQELITYTMGEYLQYKLLKFYNSFCIEKGERFYQWWEGAVEKLMNNGMFYYTGGNIQQYKNILDKEILCFLNLVKILRLILKTSKRKYMLENVDKKQLEKYIRFILAKCRMEERYGAEIFDLSKISLTGMNLSGADLKETNLQGADLREADLSGANLSEADLSGADLRGANLIEVDLSEADLSGADLSEADLSGADLSEANLIEANLSRADLSGADLIGADLSGADLRGANIDNTILEEFYTLKRRKK